MNLYHFVSRSICWSPGAVGTENQGSPIKWYENFEYYLLIINVIDILNMILTIFTITTN